MSRPWSLWPLFLKVLVVAALAPVLLSVAHADFSLNEWRYFKPIQTTAPLGGEELVVLPLDWEVFQGSADGQRDLRVIETDGSTEAAYQLVTRAGSRERRTVQGRMRDLGHVPGRYSSFVVDLEQSGNLHNRVEILTSSKNFQRNVTVETSPDGQSWAVAQYGVRIFSFTVEERGFTASDTRVSYPESSLRYLRVKIINDDEDPLEIRGATVSSVREVPAAETTYPAAIIDSYQDAEAHTGIVELGLGSEGLPVDRLILRTPSVNFYREVSVQGSDDRDTWRTLVGGAAVYSYQTPKFAGDSLEVGFPESAFRYFRLVIENLDDPPLPVEEVAFSGVKRTVLFLARPAASYALFYGNEEARAPSYDLARLLPYLDTESPAEASLGPQQANPGYAELQPPASERYPWLITVAVAAAAVVVAAILVGVFRQVRKALPPPDAGESGP